MTDFDRIFLKYQHPLFLYTLKFIEDEDEALDLVQDVFLSVWEHGQPLKIDDQTKAYLFASTKNSCLNYIKHQKIVRKFEHQSTLQLKETEAIYYQSGEKSFFLRITLQ